MRAAGAKKPAIRGGLKSGRKRRNAGKGNLRWFAPAMCGAFHTAIEKVRCTSRKAPAASGAS